MPRYLIRKLAEPEAYGQAYADSLSTLEGSEETLMETPEGVIKVREAPEDQLEELRSRTHILLAEVDGVATVQGGPVEGEVGAQAIRLSAAQSRALHGIDKAHAKGKKGTGRKVCVIDTGIPRSLKDRYSQITYLGSAVPGEDSYDESGSSHGGWCTSTIIGIAPEAEHTVIKGLSSKDGSGQYSWIINALNKAVEIGCTEINMSLGGPKSEALNSACRAAVQKGVEVNRRVVVAAGNEQSGKTTFEADAKSPASEIMCETCGSKNSDKLTAPYSNHGNCLDIGGAGDQVECNDPDIVPGHYRGTSMAAPHICGMSAILDGNLKALNVTAEDTNEPIHVEGAGFANVFAALEKLEPPKPEPIPEPKPEPPKDCGEQPTLSTYMKRYWQAKKRYDECAKGQAGAITRMLGR